MKSMSVLTSQRDGRISPDTKSPPFIPRELHVCLSSSNMNTLPAYSVKLLLSDPRIRLSLFNAFVPSEVSIQVVPLLILSELQIPEANYHHVF